MTEKKEHSEAPKHHSRKKASTDVKARLTGAGVSEVHVHKLEELSSKLGGLDWDVMVQLAQVGGPTVPLLLALFDVKEE